MENISRFRFQVKRALLAMLLLRPSSLFPLNAFYLFLLSLLLLL